jgi:hypothetical protein
MAPAFGPIIGILRTILDFDLFWFISNPLLTTAEGLGCAIGQTRKRDRWLASPLKRTTTHGGFLTGLQQLRRGYGP